MQPSPPMPDLVAPSRPPDRPRDADPRDDILDTLRGRILRGLHAGTLAAGERLPSARALVAEFGVDHRQILAVYRRLAAEGLVELRARGGIYVAPRHGAGDAMRPLPEDWLVDVLARGLARELPPAELHEWLRRCTETLRLRAAVVATTWDELSGLARGARACGAASSPSPRRA